MSLTGTSPLIRDWIELGLEWRWFWKPVLRPFTIPANGRVQIPSEEFTFKAPEGVMLTFNVTFDHPDCGIKAEGHPEFDTGDIITVRNLVASGAVNHPTHLAAFIPPQTPPGIYGIGMNKEWPWTEWLKLYLLNTDSVPHRCLVYTYTMAVLKEPRPAARRAS